jgi:hypothetical protein
MPAGAGTGVVFSGGPVGGEFTGGTVVVVVGGTVVIGG